MNIDPISNFITSISNAAKTGKRVVRTPYSMMKQAIAEVLASEGYIEELTKKGKKTGQKYLEVSVVYDEEGSRVHGVKRVSKPSRRVYKGAKDIHPVRHGYGRIIVSTPEGIMTGEAARKANTGGEALFEIW
jgi:small subunit ribosomal protein S8